MPRTVMIWQKEVIPNFENILRYFAKISAPFRIIGLGLGLEKSHLSPMFWLNLKCYCGFEGPYKCHIHVRECPTH